MWTTPRGVCGLFNLTTHLEGLSRAACGQLLEESVDFSTTIGTWLLKGDDEQWTTPRGVCGLFNAIT